MATPQNLLCIKISNHLACEKWEQKPKCHVNVFECKSLHLQNCLLKDNFCVFRKVWDAVSGDEVLTLAHKHIVKTVNFTQVSAVSAYSYDIWWILLFLDISCVYLFGWDELVYFCLFYQDSNCLLTGGNDKLLRIYDLNNTEAGKWMWKLAYTSDSSNLKSRLCDFEAQCIIKKKEEVQSYSSQFLTFVLYHFYVLM